MSKNVRTIIILLVALALCAGLYVGVTRMVKNDEEQAAADEEASIINIGDIVEEVQYISLTSGGVTLEFLNTGEKWIYYQDENFPLKDSYMTAIVDAAVGLTAIREIEITDELSSYSLDEGSYMAVRILDDNNDVFSLDIGAPIGDGSTFYARDPMLDTLYVISNELPMAVSFDLYDMVEIESFGTFEAADISSITVTAGDKQLVYQQETSEVPFETGEIDEDTGEEVYESSIISTWYDASTDEPVLMNDITTPTSLAETAAAFEFASCRHYNASETLLEESGIASPRLTITVTWTDISGEEVSQSMTIGRVNGNGSYWAKLGDSPAVYEIAASYVEPFVNAIEVSE